MKKENTNLWFRDQIRDWLYVDDHISALELILKKWEKGKYV